MSNIHTDVQNRYQQLKQYFKQNITQFKTHLPLDQANQLGLDFQHELDHFYKLCVSPQLNNRFIIGIGGAFSAGKSSFLNGLLGQKLLSVEIDPTTSIPTYLVQGTDNRITAILKSGENQTLSTEQFKNLTHHAEQDDRALIDSIDLIIVEQAHFPWQNLSFLDTPGYSNTESSEQGNCDAHIAKVQLNDAQRIIWLISADQGVISESDLQFLKTLKADIPKLIIISRADKKTEIDLELIQSVTAQTLTQHGIQSEAVLTYSARQSQGFDRSLLNQYLEDWNAQPQILSVLDNFVEYFAEIKTHLSELHHQVDLDSFQKNLFEQIYQLAQLANVDIETQWQHYLAQQFAIEQQRQEALAQYQAELEREAQAIADEQERQRQALEMQKAQDLLARAEQIKNQAQAIQPIRRSLESILESYEDEISRPSAGSYLIDDIYGVRKKVDKAIKAYAFEGDGEYGKYNDDPLVLMDTTTIFKNAENGLFLTHSELYCKDMLGKRFVTRLNQIRSIRFDRDESKLYVNGDERLYVPQDNLKKPIMALVKAVKEYLDQ